MAEHDKLKHTLADLHHSLSETEGVEQEVQDMLAVLDDDIHRLLEHGASHDEEEHGILHRAEAAATRLGVDHPHLERFMREVIDTLGRIGV